MSNSFKFKTKVLVLLASALCFMLVAPVLRAQQANGSISGTVVDQSGAAVPGAQVQATNTATAAVSAATTGSSGSFLLANLAVGSYNVKVTKSGFKGHVSTGVAVAAGVNYSLGNISLTIGSTATTVEVSAAPPLLQSSQAQISSTFTSSQMNNFPGLQGNNGLDNMAVLLPGINDARDNSFSNSNGPDFSVNGLRSRNNDQQIDGQNNNDNSVGGPGLFLSNPLFVSEYQITTDNFGPEYGRNAGSVVNLITKSGGNVWHGEIVGSESNSVLNTLSTADKAFFGITRNPRFNDEFTGATIGGPIWKNHVFVFGGFDDEIFSSVGVFQDAGLTPTPIGVGELASCFPGSATVAALAAYGPYSIGAGNPTPTTGNEITNFKVIGATVPNGGTDANGNGVCNVDMAGIQRILGNGSHEYDWDYRTDVVISDQDRFFGRYLFNKSRAFNATGDGAAGYVADVPALSQSFLGDWVHTFSGEMVNDFRASFSRLNVDFGGNSFGNSIPPQGQIGAALARITFSQAGSSFTGFGPATNLPQGRIVNTYQLQDNWSYFQGRNQWKAGFNFTYQRSPNIFLPNFNGAYSFGTIKNSSASAISYANTGCSVNLPAGSSLPGFSAFACNAPSTVTVADGSPSLDFREKDTFLYVGDDYKLKNNLILNLGLTWTYFGQPSNLFHTLTQQNETGPNPLFNPALPLSVRTFPEIPAEKNLFGPSIGFAYTPRWGGWLTGGDQSKTVLRGGYRLAYDPPYYNIYINISSSTPVVLLQTLRSSINSTTNTLVPAPSLPTDPHGPGVRASLASFLTPGVFDPRQFNQTTITPNFGPDKVHEWSFGIQREISNHLVVESRYVGNHGFNLYQSINANPYIAGMAASFPNLLPAGVTPCPASSAVVPSAVGRVNCNEGVLRQRTNTGYSDYEGWQNEIRANNLFNQLTILGSYTRSKTTDNVSEIFSTFGGGNTDAFSQNPLNYTSAEHGLSGLDYPNQFTLTFNWEVPFLRAQHGVIGHVFGGWGVSSAYVWRSGQTYSPAQIFSNYFSGGVANDTTFDLGFIGLFETSRAFLANSSAPITAVGIYAGDACSLFGSACSMATNTLLDYNALNVSGGATVNPVANSQVHFILNGGTADSIFGTPFGNAARNSLRDYHTNTANLFLYKNIRFSERVGLQWSMTMLNAFNHPNFGSVDPFVDDAGLQQIPGNFGTGFADPQQFNGGNRVIKFGLQLNF